jgi:hypothetical protein
MSFGGEALKSSVEAMAVWRAEADGASFPQLE